MGFAALDGVLWVFGGCGSGGNRDDLFAYTIAARAWRQLGAAAGVSGTPPSTRRQMGFSAVAGGLLVTYGTCCSLRDAHFFDVAAQAWRALPVPPEKGWLVQTSSRGGPSQAVLNGINTQEPLCLAANSMEASIMISSRSSWGMPRRSGWRSR